MADDPRIGATLAGKYSITRLIGRGAFGSVYEAMNLELEKRVAVKLIEPQYVKHEEVVARFRVEARAASRVESEHIVQVFDVGNDEKHGLYMVMELLHGEDLADRLDREFKLSPALAVHVAVQAARGLAKAHAAGVVHRDLKPANIFLITREDGALLVKLVDFGISKLLGHDEPTGGRALTRSGTTVGTPNYMSPEQARGQAVDGRTDVWALGAVLYEMLAGAVAYPQDMPYEEMIIAIATGPEPRVAEVAPWVPPAVAAVVDRALTRDIDKRIQDCGELARLLSEAMPNATRPRREESLYMEPSDFTAGTVDPQPADDVPVEITNDPSRAKTTIARAKTVQTRKRRWPLLLIPLALLLIGVGVWKSGAFLEPAPPAPPTPAETASASESASAPKPSATPKPVFHPKPKLSTTTKPSTKPSVSTKPSAKPSG